MARNASPTLGFPDATDIRVIKLPAAGARPSSITRRYQPQRAEIVINCGASARAVWMANL
jgi:hypothetical protein